MTEEAPTLFNVEQVGGGCQLHFIDSSWTRRLNEQELDCTQTMLILYGPPTSGQ